METTAKEVARILLATGAVALRPEEPFRFSSGILSPVYCDNRLLVGEVEERRVLSQLIAEGVRQVAGLELVAGTATAGIAWAAWVAELVDLPMAYIRSEAKAHGKGKQIEGGARPGQRVVLVEDTISTGGSSLRAAAALREAGLQIEDCWCIFSYGMSEARQGFSTAGIRLRSLTTLEALLEVAVAEQRLAADGRAAIEEWALDPRGWRSGA